MSETQRKDSTEKQAWEHIAPELPPGWSVEPGPMQRGKHYWSTFAAEGEIVERDWSSREGAVGDCWYSFGITRKRYAELIAPQRVREAAEQKHGYRLSAVCWTETFAGFRVSVSHVGTDGLLRHVGSGAEFTDICTAAWVAIQALGGGE